MGRKILALALISLCLTGPLSAADDFPTSPLLEENISFWQKIFTRYTSAEAVVHDLDRPHLILGSFEIAPSGLGPRFKATIAERIDSELDRYDEALEDFATQGDKARRLSSLHEKIWGLYHRNTDDQQRLLSGAIELRTQGGLSDTFVKAFATSELYLPRMEKIFRAQGLPPQLTRIVFVESMFNLKARSKVGASGLWQLMPAAARPFLTVNQRKDERNSPYLATAAAARILRSNYQALGTWPIAITAYNHGLGGMRRAMAQTGSRELSDIIASYSSPSFGFASQNFYAEFIAAWRTHKSMALANAKVRKHGKARQKLALDAPKQR